MIDYEAKESKPYKLIYELLDKMDYYLKDQTLFSSEGFLKDENNLSIKELALQAKQLETKLGPTPEIMAIYDKIIFAKEKAKIRKALRIGKFTLLSMTTYKAFLADIIKNNNSSIVDGIIFSICALFFGWFNYTICDSFLHYSGYTKEDRIKILEETKEVLNKIKQQLSPEEFKRLMNLGKQLAQYSFEDLNSSRTAIIEDSDKINNMKDIEGEEKSVHRR